MDSITAILGWCSLLNTAMLILASLMLIVARNPITRIHAGLFGLDESDLAPAYFQYLAQYKIATFVFNIAPYLALKIVG
jgi:hypothetical protein